MALVAKKAQNRFKFVSPANRDPQQEADSSKYKVHSHNSESSSNRSQHRNSNKLKLESFSLPNWDAFTYTDTTKSKGIPVEVLLERTNKSSQSENSQLTANSKSIYTQIFSAFKNLGASFKEALKSLNPLEFFSRFKADFQALKHAAEVKNYDQNKRDLASLSKSINGRVFASLILSDVCAYVAAPLGAAIQLTSGSWALGLSVGMAAAYAIAVGSFQAAYAFSTRDMYKQNTNGFKDFIHKFERDLAPIHKKCFFAAIACNLISVPLCSGLAMAMKFLPQAYQNVIPISFVELILAITIFDSMFVKSMSKFNEQYSKTLAKRYLKQD